jgi:Na+/melibiose symporter-like transporter
MSRNHAKEEVISARYWFFALLLLALPLVNLIAVPVMALFGKNQSKKNFFRAAILWVALLVGLNLVAILIVGGRAYLNAVQNYKESDIEKAIKKVIVADDEKIAPGERQIRSIKPE